jgi:hypothetical protein
MIVSDGAFFGNIDFGRLQSKSFFGKIINKEIDGRVQFN